MKAISRAAYKQAAIDVYYGSGTNMHNPGLYFKLMDGPGRKAGFFTSSTLMSHNEDEILVFEGSVDANTGNARIPKFESVMAMITRELRNVQAS